MFRETTETCVIISAPPGTQRIIKSSEHKKGCNKESPTQLLSSWTH